MKTRHGWKKSALVAATGLALTAGMAFAGGAQNRNGNGASGGGTASAGASPVAVAPVASAAEQQWLVYLREEEKVARDVYLYLHDLWPVPVFENIAASEQRHMDAVKTLLDRYNLADPAAETEVGRFANPELQALYDELVAVGSESLKQALGVGVLIEETDIADLDAAIAASTHPDIQKVFSNLRAGSLNHLDAFLFALDLLEQDE